MSHTQTKILIASDSERRRNHLMASLVRMNYVARCASADEILKNDHEFQICRPDLIILDPGAGLTDDTIRLAGNLESRLQRPVVFLLSDDLAKKELAKHQEPHIQYITRNSTDHEIDLAITYQLLRLDIMRHRNERKREQWLLNAVSCLFQESPAPSEALAGIIGILSTTMNINCAIIGIDPETGRPQEFISTSTRKKTNSGTRQISIADILSRTGSPEYLHSVDWTGTEPAHHGEKNNQEPPSTRIALGIITSISTPASAPTSLSPFRAPYYLWVHSATPRIFTESDRHLISWAASYCAIILSTPGPGVLPARSYAQES